MPITPEQKAVKAASKKSQDELVALDKRKAEEVRHAFRQAVDDIGQFLLAAAGSAGVVAVSAMPYLLQQIRARLGNLGSARDQLLAQGIEQAAALGTQPFGNRLPASQLDQIRSEAISYVRSFTGDGDLTLSDRIWRLDRHAQEIVQQAVQNAIMRGDGAAKAAQEFLARRIQPPADIALAKEAGTASHIAGTVEESLFTGRGTPFDNTLRVMRTEINRSHTRAYQQGVAADPEAIGTRFTLSPRHPRVDICDMHARANLYGLGAGVYPAGKSPLPAHPNTLSFEVVVYRDEISAADREGKQTVMEFLNTVPSKDRAGILGANKNEAFEAGQLPATQVRSTWRAVQKRISRINRQ